MGHMGQIKSYDANKGAGTIMPEKGGNALPFKKADLQQQAQEPKVDDRYEYETSEVDGGHKRAVNLQQQGEEAAKQDQASKQQG